MSDTVTVTVWLAEAAKVSDTVTVTVWLAEAAEVTDTVVVTVWWLLAEAAQVTDTGTSWKPLYMFLVDCGQGGKNNKKSIWLVVFEIQLLVMLNCSGILYGLTRLMYDITFNLNDCFFFGAIISATDPGQSLTCLRFFVFRFLSFILPLHLFCIQ